ncbi:MAG: hypothetical protein AAGN46_04900, partial [Acidobacteriota bacterium]
MTIVAALTLGGLKRPPGVIFQIDEVPEHVVWIATGHRIIVLAGVWVVGAVEEIGRQVQIRTTRRRLAGSVITAMLALAHADVCRLS